MTLQSVRAGDLIEVDRKGRRFYAEVQEKDGRDLLIRPLDSRLSYYSCKAREVVNHWRKSKASCG